MTPGNFEKFLPRLSSYGVRYILIGGVAGEGTYAKLISHCDQFQLYGYNINVVSLKKLIELKRAAGRPKDFEVIAELEALQQERDQNSAASS